MPNRNETCRTCRWWWPNASPENKSATLDPSYPDEVHWRCENPLLDCYVNIKDAPSGLSSYEEIETGPDFGCIHWTSKTP